MVEAALAAAAPGSDQCVVLVEETSEVEVRFANNTTTTNGSRRDRRVTVISLRQVEGGMAAGVARRGGDVDVTELVRAAEQDAAGFTAGRRCQPAPHARRPPACPGASTPLPPAPRPPPICPVLSGVLDRPVGRPSTGPAGPTTSWPASPSTAQTTEYLGTSTGLRLAHAQPQGALHLVARSADGISSTWAGAGTTDFTDVSVEELEDRLPERLAWSARRLERPAGRYEVLLPPEAVERPDGGAGL